MDDLVPAAPSRRDLILLRVNELSGGDTNKFLQLEELAWPLGLTFEQARDVAEQLDRLGLVCFQTYLKRGAPGGLGGEVGITRRGVDEAWRLRLPWWWRWSKRDTIVAVAVTTAVSTILSAVVASIVTFLLARWLTP